MVGLYIPLSQDIGPKLWRFPEDLLADESFCLQLKLVLDNFSTRNASQLWEEIKNKIQSIAQKAMKFCHKQLMCEIKALKHNLCTVNKRIFNGEILDEDRMQLERCITELISLRRTDNDHDIELDWVAIEGKMDPWFLHLEDEKSSLFLESIELNGTLIDDIPDVLDHLNHFYTDLYAKQDSVSPQDIDSFLQNLEFLPQALNSDLFISGEIAEQEVVDAIKQLCPGKSPGSDGINSVFNKHFIDEVAPILCTVFNEAFS